MSKACFPLNLATLSGDVQAVMQALWLKPPTHWAAWRRCCTWWPAGCRLSHYRHEMDNDICHHACIYATFQP